MPTPAELLGRLDAIAASLQSRSGALLLLGLGSVGSDLHRLDQYSDLDFFVVVEPEFKADFLGHTDWLEAAHPLSFSFQNTPDGRKALFADGIFAEYAVFAPEELHAAGHSPGRIVWSRDAPQPSGPLDVVPRQQPAGAAAPPLEWHVAEALTNLLIGLRREARGERLTALRFVQSYAIDRVLSIAGLLEAAPEGDQDTYDANRRVEQHWPELAAHLPAMLPGYGRCREAARAILTWLEARVALPPALVAEIMLLLGDDPSASP